MGAPGDRIIGRYALCDKIASGGMATVHLGKRLGEVGVSHTVAIKRLHTRFANDPEFVNMLLDEAQVVAHIRHPNVVPMLDVVAVGGEVFLVMEYVEGEALSRLIGATPDVHRLVPAHVVASIMHGALQGLHAAHEARNERGEPLGIVHRDVSPHNVLVGIDGIARVVDFGVAKAAGRIQTTKAGQLKGKISYLAPEQARDDVVTRQTDVYAAAVVMWEALTGQRLFYGDNDGVILHRITQAHVEPPSQVRLETANTVHAAGSFEDIKALDAIVMRGLARDPARRFASAREMAYAIETSIRLASPVEVGDWVVKVAGAALEDRARRLADAEARTAGLAPMGADSSVIALPPLPHGVATLPLTSAASLPNAPPVAMAATRSAASDERPTPPAANFDVRTGLTPSQMSSISVSTPSRVTATPAERPRRWWLVGGGAAVGAFTLAAAIVFAAGAIRKHRAGPRSVATTRGTTEAAQRIVSPPAVDTPPPTPTLPDSTVAPASATVPPEAPTDVAKPTVAPTHSAATVPPAPKPPAISAGTMHKAAGNAGAGAKSDDCKPPYTIDAEGTKHYKANCL